MRKKSIISSHLDQLESESIHIMREVASSAKNPVLLYSIGKDSSVLLHLALKAFSRMKKLPFSFLHVDTLWKFKEMIEFRNNVSKDLNLDLIVYTNPEGIQENVGPFTHGSRIHTDIMKTQALKQALEKYNFDLIIGGARRDEEASRSKERIFSFRNSLHGWSPKMQRPELWNLYNPMINKDESIRVFPLSNWTELDIWLYIRREQIPIVPLYFSKEREIINHDGINILVDDNRIPPDKESFIRSVRFRTLGCYPLTGAIDSKADSIEKVIEEVICSKYSERADRVIDKDQVGSMELKKMEGYF